MVRVRKRGRRRKNHKKAFIYLTVPRNDPRRHCNVETWSLFHQCEVIKRKSAQLNADINAEFVIPKQFNLVTDPLFRQMLHVISTQGIDYVLIYPDRPHRIYKRSAKVARDIFTTALTLLARPQRLYKTMTDSQRKLLNALLFTKITGEQLAEPFDALIPLGRYFTQHGTLPTPTPVDLPDAATDPQTTTASQGNP
jgi:hypothetical protein